MNLGATAIGTGINTDPRYAALAVEELARISGQPMVLATNLVEATSDMGAFVLFSGLLKRIAVKLSKICNDLRLLSSGPRTGFARDQPAADAGRLLDHAREGEPGHPGGREPGGVPGHRPRPTSHPVRRGRPAPAQRLRADDRLLPPAVDADADRRPRHADQALRRRHRGRPRALPRARRSTASASSPRSTRCSATRRCSRVAKRALEEDRGVVDIVLEEGLLTEAQVAQLLRPKA